jgi:hypothetical protein
MADNQVTEPLVSDVKAPELIIPFLLLVVTSSGMSISGLGYAAVVFDIKGFLWALIWIVLIGLTYWLNSLVVVRACYHKHKYSFSRLVKELYGRKRGLTVQILMALHNIIILTYLQQRIAANAFKLFHLKGSIEYTDTFYYVAIANIPLILLALQNKYEKVRWFAIIGILVWVYLFIGIITEALSVDDELAVSYDSQAFPEAGPWMILSIGTIAYFMSFFQIVPYVSEQVKDEQGMKRCVLYSVVAAIIIVLSKVIYMVLTSDKDLDVIRYAGLVIIGGCVTIINVLPTRELIVQILEEDAKDKRQTRDRFITLSVLTVTLVLSIFANSPGTWKVFIGIGTVLTGLLGFIFPSVVFHTIKSHSEKNKSILLLVWNVLLGVTVLVAGFWMMCYETPSSQPVVAA